NFQLWEKQGRKGNADSRLDANGRDEADKALLDGTYRTFSAPRTPNPATTQDEATQVSIATARCFEDLEAQQNVEKVQEHLVDEEIETMVEGTKNVDEGEFTDEIFNDQEDPDTRLEPVSPKESTKVKKSADVLIINDDEEEEESAGDELIRRNWRN
ncbi:hypothetical protein Tco_0131959, partial [Tanacetum coccineum]